MRILLPAACLLIAGCDNNPIQFDNVATPIGNAAVLSPGARPVRIGEGGPNFDACATRGVVTAAGGDALPVRAAPFEEGDEVGRIAAGQRVHVCTRSIDQRWLGIVVAAASDSGVDCGVAVRVERPRPYEGPCLSGWISSGFVRLTAN